MRYKRDTRKKRFIAALTSHGTMFHAAQAAGVSRQTAYRWQREDPEFADQWEEARENAVDVVEARSTSKLLAAIRSRLSSTSRRIVRSIATE